MHKYLAGITIASALAFIVFQVIDKKVGVTDRIAGYLPSVG